MAFFVVISLQPFADAGIAAAVSSNYQNESLNISPSSWLISANGLTTKEISEKLGIGGSPTTITSAVVLKFDSYYGVAPRNIWEWLAVKGKEP